jgi:hypothetical protein
VVANRLVFLLLFHSNKHASKNEVKIVKKIFLSIFATVVFVLYIVALVHAQEPFKFLGIKFGVPISEQDPAIHFSTPIVVSGIPMCEIPAGLNDIGIRWDKTLVHIVEDKVASVTLYMKSSEVLKMITLVSEKYGKPDTFNQKQIKTLRGVELTRTTVSWKLESITLSANDRMDAVSGYFSVFTDKYSAYLDEKREKDKKKFTGNL